MHTRFGLALVAIMPFAALAGCSTKSAEANPTPANAAAPHVDSRRKVDAPKQVVPSFTGPAMRSCDETAKTFTCTEYTGAALKFRTGEDHRGACVEPKRWTNAPCPTQGLFATCAGKQVLTRYYLAHSELYDFNEIKHDCEADNADHHFTLQP
jgi:hypothetical protein